MSATRDDDEFLIRTAKAAPYLTPETEAELVRRWCEDGDLRARADLVHSHLRMALPLAYHFGRLGLSVPDLIQEGAIGLMKASERFDASRGFRFSTYAGWWIKSAVTEYVLDNWSVVRMGTSSEQKKLFFKLRHLRASIEASMGSQATATTVNEAIATRLNVSLKEVERTSARLAPDSSLNAPVGDEEGSIEVGDLLADTADLPDEVAADLIDGERLLSRLNAALTTLNARERTIIERRKLCDAEDVETLDSLSASFGVTKERVRQIEAIALRKLQHIIRPAYA